jgi:hypothetical protein
MFYLRTEIVFRQSVVAEYTLRHASLDSLILILWNHVICFNNLLLLTKVFLARRCESSDFGPILPFSQNHLAGYVIGVCAHKMLT